MLLVRVLLLAVFFIRVQVDTTPWLSEPLIDLPADDLDPRWSPDGSQIAFVGHEAGNPEVYVFDVATNEIRNVSNDPGDDYAPLWSPDGQWLAYFHREIAYNQQPDSIKVFDPVSAEVHTLTDVESVRDLVWAGANLVITQSRRVLRYDARTQQRSEVYVVSDNDTVNFARLAPDGSKLALLLSSISSIRRRLVFVETATRKVTETGIETGLNVSWSPDSRYVALTNGGFPYLVTLMLYDTEHLVVHEVDQMTEGWIDNLVWSPDNRLAWTSLPNDTGIASVLVLEDIDDAPRILLTIAPFVEEMRWSPTRNQLAFHTFAGVYVTDVATGRFSELIQGIGRIHRMEWSADGNTIAASMYGIPDHPTGAVVVTNVRDSRQRYRHDGFVWGELRWSPAATRLVFSSDYGPDDGSIEIITAPAQ